MGSLKGVLGGSIGIYGDYLGVSRIQIIGF